MDTFFDYKKQSSLPNREKREQRNVKKPFNVVAESLKGKSLNKPKCFTH